MRSTSQIRGGRARAIFRGALLTLLGSQELALGRSCLCLEPPYCRSGIWPELAVCLPVQKGKRHQPGLDLNMLLGRKLGFNEGIAAQL
jgi:hypothetical protein